MQVRVSADRGGIKIARQGSKRANKEVNGVARGFLSGAVWGTVVAGLGAGALSVMTSLKDAPVPEATALEVPAGSQFDQARVDDAAALPEQQPGPQTGAAPMVEAPKPDDLGQMTAADTDPGDMPSAGQAQTALDAPGLTSGNTAMAVDVQAEAPVQPGGQVAAPAMPASEAELSISTDPAQPKPPEAASEQSAFGADPETGGAGPAVHSESPAEPALPEAGAANSIESQVNVDPQPVEIGESSIRPEVPKEEVVIQVVSEPEPRREPVPEAEPVVQAAAEPAVEPVAEPAAEPVAKDEATPVEQMEAEAAPVAEAEPQDEPQPEPRAEPQPEPQAEAVATVRIGKPAGSLKQLGTGVATGRLPSVTGAATEPVAEPVTEATDAAQEPADRSAMPPVERFAARFEDPENKPKMAIVLIDDGTSPVGLEALTTFPYPLSFAVDTSRADASDRMAIYRAAGFEVLAMVDMPRGAAPADVEVAMQSLMTRVPEAVAVMEAPGDGIQSDRRISDQVTEIAANTGHGLLLFSKGLNTAQKLAAKVGVRSATVFRDFDSKDQNAGTIRRFLNHAALKAGSEGGVVMVGRMRPDTVTALLLWGLQDRASQVTLAPVSQLLLVQ